MKIYNEYNFDINDFDAWSGAVDTKNRIIDEGKADEFNCLVEDIFYNDLVGYSRCGETEMNDFLWFEDEYIFEILGIKDDDEDDD